MSRNGWVTRFFSMTHPRNLPSDDGRYFAELVDFEYAIGIRQKTISAIRTIYNRDAVARLCRMLDDAHAAGMCFDVAHLHCIYHHLTPAILPLLKKRGIRVVLTAHDLKIACPAYKMMHSGGICEDCKGGNLFNLVRNRCIKDSTKLSAVIWLEAILHRSLKSYSENIDAIIAPSRFYRDKLIEWGWEAERVHYVPNFTRIIDPSFGRGYEGDILYFGRLAPEKGLATLIEASALSGVSVNIVGEGPDEEKLRKLAHSCKAPVTFLGRLVGDALWRTVGAARAVVLPSEWYENAPMSVLEAYQLMRPLIGARIGGIPELIDTPDGPAGWTFTAGDANELAALMRKVARTSPEELEGRARIGRRLALNNFSETSYFNRISDIYKFPRVSL